MSTLIRVLLGLIVACLVAGAVTVAFVVTPADIGALSGEARADRLEVAGTLALLAATHSAIFAAPFAIVAVIIGEWLAVRSWLYYVLIAIAIALAGFSAEVLAEVEGQPTIVNDYALRAFLAAGFFSGLAYWLMAGRRAGGRRGDAARMERQASKPAPEDSEADADDETSEPPASAKLATSAG